MSKKAGKNLPVRGNIWTKKLRNTIHADIGRELGVSRALVNGWAKGEYHPSHKNVLKILKIYPDVTMYDIREHYAKKRKPRSKSNEQRGKKVKSIR